MRSCVLDVDYTLIGTHLFTLDRVFIVVHTIIFIIFDFHLRKPVNTY